MGLFNRKPTSCLPSYPKLPELTFYVWEKEYWLGMSVKESGLRFEKEKDSHRILKGNKNTTFPVVYMKDNYNNDFYVGFVNRGIEPIEYQDAEIAFILINVDSFTMSSAKFFRNISYSTPLNEIVNIFKSNSNFEIEEADAEICYVFNNQDSDVSFAVNEDGLCEVQYNLYK